jgi:hypothetical protein
MIPKAINDQLNKLKRMESCECCGSREVQRHHALSHRNRSIQEVYAIRALCATCHMGNSMKPIRKADVISKINAITEGEKHLMENYKPTNWSQELKRYKHELSQIQEKEAQLLKAKLNGHI